MQQNKSRLDKTGGSGHYQRLVQQLNSIYQNTYCGFDIGTVEHLIVDLLDKQLVEEWELVRLKIMLDNHR